MGPQIELNLFVTHGPAVNVGLDLSRAARRGVHVCRECKKRFNPRGNPIHHRQLLGDGGGGGGGGDGEGAVVKVTGATRALREREGVPRTRLVPTAAQKAGLFSTAVFDPFAPGRPQFSKNAQGQWVIPQNRWDPVGAAIVALIPDPNVPGTNIFASTPITKTRQDQFDVRIDHQLSGNKFSGPDEHAAKVPLEIFR